jgi:undecaprenyl-diphosphatase
MRPMPILRNLLERAAGYGLIARAARIEPMTLLAIILGAALLLGFAKLANLASRGGAPAFDEWLILALRTPGNLADPIGPAWLDEMMRDFTALGSTGVLTVMVLAVAGFLAMTRKGLTAVFVLASVTGGVLISQTMKWAYARPRPDLVPHGTEVFTASFPSGHSMMSAVVYLTLGALLARTQLDRAVKSYVMAMAVLLTVLVGVSRVYLGVHWPTDVLAGWALGGLWALVCLMAMLWLQSRGQVEDDTQGGGALREEDDGRR